MKQRVRSVGVLRTNTITFGLMILATASVFCSLLGGEVRALSLPGIIDDVAAPILDTLPGKNEQASPPVAPAAASNRQQAAPAAASAPVPVSDTSTNSSQVAGYNAHLEPLPAYSQRLQQLNASHLGGQPVLAHSLRARPSSSFALLQPSEQGWQIAGIAWYWWGCAGVVAWLGVRRVQRWRLGRVTQKMLVS